MDLWPICQLFLSRSIGHLKNATCMASFQGGGIYCAGNPYCTYRDAKWLKMTKSNVNIIGCNGQNKPSLAKG